MLFADLLSLHLVTFLMFFILVVAALTSNRVGKVFSMPGNDENGVFHCPQTDN